LVPGTGQELVHPCHKRVTKAADHALALDQGLPRRLVFEDALVEHLADAIEVRTRDGMQRAQRLLVGDAESDVSLQFLEEGFRHDGIVLQLRSHATQVLHMIGAITVRVERFLRGQETEDAMVRVPEIRSARLARKALLARKEQIGAVAARLERSEEELQAVCHPDGAADLEAHDVLQALRSAETIDLAEVEAALLRISIGTYGRCERCSGPVGELRLWAVPQARFCMACMAVR